MRVKRAAGRGLVVAGIAVCACLGATLPASADDPPPPPPGVGGGAGGGSGGNQISSRLAPIVIVVTATGTPDGGAPVTLSIPSPPQTCGFEEGLTGAQMKALEKTQGYIERHTGEKFSLPPGTDEHATDGPEVGRWYGPECTELENQSAADFFAVADTFFQANPQDVWVVVGTNPPVPVIPSRVLAEAVDGKNKQIPLPPLQVSRNPGNDAITRLPTWFWIDRQTPSTVSVRASVAGTGYYAVTTGVVQGLQLSVEGSPELSASCPGGGTPYKSDARPDCTITFTRTAGPAGYTVDESAHWTVSYTGWDQATPVPLPAQDSTSTQQVVATEIDSVNVTG